MTRTSSDPVQAQEETASHSGLCVCLSRPSSQPQSSTDTVLWALRYGLQSSLDHTTCADCICPHVSHHPTITWRFLSATVRQGDDPSEPTFLLMDRNPLSLSPSTLGHSYMDLGSSPTRGLCARRPRGVWVAVTCTGKS